MATGRLTRTQVQSLWNKTKSGEISWEVRGFETEISANGTTYASVLNSNCGISARAGLWFHIILENGNKMVVPFFSRSGMLLRHHLCWLARKEFKRFFLNTRQKTEEENRTKTFKQAFDLLGE